MPEADKGADAAAKTFLPKPGYATLFIHPEKAPNPDGIDIQVDGRFVGKVHVLVSGTALYQMLSVPPGEHTIRANAFDSDAPGEITVNAKAGSNYFFRVGMKGFWPVRKTIIAESEEEGRKNILRARLAVAPSFAKATVTARPEKTERSVVPEPIVDEVPAVAGPTESPDDQTGTELLAKVRARIAPFTLDDLTTDFVIVDDSPQRPSASGLRQPAASDVRYEYKTKNIPNAPQSTFTFNNEKIAKQTKTRTENGQLYSVTMVTGRVKSRLQRIEIYLKEGTVAVKDLYDGTFGTMTLVLNQPAPGRTRLGFNRAEFLDGKPPVTYVWEASGKWEIKGSGGLEKKE